MQGRGVVNLTVCSISNFIISLACSTDPCNEVIILDTNLETVKVTTVNEQHFKQSLSANYHRIIDKMLSINIQQKNIKHRGTFASQRKWDWQQF